MLLMEGRVAQYQLWRSVLEATETIGLDKAALSGQGGQNTLYIVPGGRDREV
jgi:hypothetical protein